MCGLCGCGDARLEDHVHGHVYDPMHEALHTAEILHHRNHALAPGGHEPGERVIAIEEAVLSQNDALAQRNRSCFEMSGVLALNLLSSPGSGKTTLLCRTVEELAGRMPVAVIEGDQQTSFDADRVRAAGAPAVQINTGKGCHLDAAMVSVAMEGLPLRHGTVLFIENVGNLVCPAAFDLGEAARIVILSVTEGDDKPLKYPDMFASADLLVLNKIDLLPYLDFDLPRCLDLAHRLNPRVEAISVSARSGEGMAAWIDWIAARLAGRRAT